MSSVVAQRPAQESLFIAALPYGAGALAIGAVSATCALACKALAVKVIAVVAALLSVYAFLGIILCAIKHSDNPQAFKENVCTHVTTGFGVAVATMIEQVARSVFQAMIDSCLRGAF